MGVAEDEYADNLEVWPARGLGLDIFAIGKKLDQTEPGKYLAIAIDAKYRAMPIDADENSNADETAFFNEVDRIANHTQACIILVHHSTKGGQKDKRVVDVGAGASAQARAADAHLVLREHEDENVAVLAAAVRSFEAVTPIALRWKFPIWTLDESKDPAELKGRRSICEERQKRQDTEAQRKVLDAAEEWTSRPELKRATGLGYGRLDRAIAALQSAGNLEQKQVEQSNKTGPKIVTRFRRMTYRSGEGIET